MSTQRHTLHGMNVCNFRWGDHMAVEKKVYSFRFDERLVDQLKYYAQEENRTLSNFVETILKEYLNQKSIQETA